MRLTTLLLITALFLIPVSFAVVPTDGMVVTASIEFDPGTYIINNVINVTGDNIVINCNGTVLKTDDGTTNNILQISNANSLTIRGCTFDGTDSNSGDNGIAEPYGADYSKSDNDVFIGNKFINIMQGIALNVNNTARNMTVANNLFENNSIALWSEPTDLSGLRFINNTVIGIRSESTYISTPNPSNIVFLDNSFLGTPFNAAYIYGYWAAPVTTINNITFMNNYVTGDITRTMDIVYLSANNIYNILIKNNTMENIDGYLTYTYASDKLINFTATDNKCTNFSIDAIDVYGNNNVSNILISNNVLRNTGNWSIYLSSSVDISNAIISNNNITSGDYYGIAMNSQSGSVNVTGNTVHMNENASDQNLIQYGVYTYGTNLEYSNNDVSAPLGFDYYLGNSYNQTLIKGGGAITLPSSVYISSSAPSAIYLGGNMMSINTSAQPYMNVSSRVTLNLGNNVCPALIYYYPDFTTSFSTIKSSGQVCNTGTNPACTNIVCSGHTVSFDVPHFDSYGAEGEPAPIPEFDAFTLLIAAIAAIIGISLIRNQTKD